MDRKESICLYAKLVSSIAAAQIDVPNSWVVGVSWKWSKSTPEIRSSRNLQTAASAESLISPKGTSGSLVQRHWPDAARKDNFRMRS
jgi:hypothetical protein